MSQIKLKHSGGNSVIIAAPDSNPASDRTLKLPSDSDGTILSSASTLDATKLSGNLPALNGSALTGISTGITMVDQWTLYENYEVNGGETILSADKWARTSHALFGSIGSAMTVSSGVFTFPTTGIYLIIATFTGSPQSSSSTYVGMKIQGTTDNFSSSDVLLANHYDSASGSSTYVNVTVVTPFDCTNTSTHKIRLKTEVQNNFRWGGGQGKGLTFIRLGDT